MVEEGIFLLILRCEEDEGERPRQRSPSWYVTNVCKNSDEWSF